MKKNHAESRESKLEKMRKNHAENRDSRLEEMKKNHVQNRAERCLNMKECRERERSEKESQEVETRVNFDNTNMRHNIAMEPGENVDRHLKTTRIVQRQTHSSIT